ncbi:hypothetical protein QUC31_009717 [Theobroma cacao]
MIIVYAPCDANDKLSLWVDLSSSFSEFLRSWCCAGGFNTVKCLEEQHGCAQFSVGIGDFNNFIDRCELTNLPLVGMKFTWYGPKAKRSRIDRFLLSSQWLLQFQNLC